MAARAAPALRRMLAALAAIAFLITGFASAPVMPALSHNYLQAKSN